MPQKLLTKDGRLLDLGEEGGAHLVDTDEPGAEAFIESVREKWAREHPEEAKPSEADKIAQTSDSPEPLIGIGEKLPPADQKTDEKDEDETGELAALGKKIEAALAAVGITTREQLAPKTDAELDAIPQIGADSIKTIRAFLAEGDASKTEDSQGQTQE